MAAAGKQQFNVYLPVPLVRRLKHASVDAGMSLSPFVEQALEDYLRRLREEEKDVKFASVRCSRHRTYTY